MFTPSTNNWVLKNGAKCCASFMPDCPLTCVDLWSKAGSVFERPSEKGMAHFLEHMIFKGSSKLKEGEFDQKIEACGGSSNAATGFDDVHFYVLIPPNQLANTIDLLSNLVLTPTINSKAFLSEREVVLEEIAQSDDQPDERIFQKLLAHCWYDHPYGKSILGNKGSVRSITPEKMKIFHKRNYSSENLTLSIAGNIPSNLEDVIKNSQFSQSIKTDKTDKTNQNNGNEIFNAGYVEIKAKRIEFARILIAWPLPPAKKQEFIFGADIATTLLAEGRRSRLVAHIRENLNIVDTIDMDITPLEQGGLIILEATCLEENVCLVEKEIRDILLRTFEGNIELDELKRAKKLVSNSHCFSMETSSSVASACGYQTLWNRQQHLLKPLEYIEKWTTVDLQRKIFSILASDNNYTLIAKPERI